MSIRSYLSIFFLLTFSLVKSQSFENVSLVNKKMETYPFNESNAYLSDDGNTLFFNSSDNTNNTSGRSLLQRLPPRARGPESTSPYCLARQEGASSRSPADIQIIRIIQIT